MFKQKSIESRPENATRRWGAKKIVHENTNIL